MKSNKTIVYRMVHFAMLMVVILTTWSCTGNDNTTNAKDTDSTNMKDNNMTTTARMMNDSAANTINDNTKTDAAFMMKAAEINLEEIKLGKLAQQKGTTPHVKQLGKMMVTDHAQAMDELTALAKTKMVTIPTSETAKIMDAYKTLNGKTGKDFDKAYSDMMVNGHKEAIALFEKTAMETKDSDVKAMTTTMIPKLKTHLEQAEICLKESAKM